MRPVVRFTDISAGSFGLGEQPGRLCERRRALTDLPVTWLTQVHGAAVVDVEQPGEHPGARADAAVTSIPGAALSVITADCAPVVLTSPEAVGVAHAGWRGLVAGVLENTVGALRRKGADRVEAWLGPCIRPRCYEFGAVDLDEVAARFGERVRAHTAWGSAALDVPGAVRSALAGVGVDVVHDDGVCTACSPVHFSHRARCEAGRQAAFVWLEV